MRGRCTRCCTRPAAGQASGLRAQDSARAATARSPTPLPALVPTWSEQQRAHGASRPPREAAGGGDKSSARGLELGEGGGELAEQDHNLVALATTRNCPLLLLREQQRLTTSESSTSMAAPLSALSMLPRPRVAGPAAPCAPARRVRGLRPHRSAMAFAALPDAEPNPLVRCRLSSLTRSWRSPAPTHAHSA